LIPTAKSISLVSAASIYLKTLQALDQVIEYSVIWSYFVINILSLPICFDEVGVQQDEAASGILEKC
jgi:hypothetical protein